MDRETFCEALLEVMERKVHWAWPGFTSGLVPKPLLHIHLEQEYATYVRDFPTLLAHAFVQCPNPAVRRDLAENLYEEETGGLVAGRPHPELFLEYPRGLGFDLERFKHVTLLKGAHAYRAILNESVRAKGWPVATAVTTLFIEGTPYERGELDETAPKRPAPALEEHPLVKHYGLPLEHLALTKAHRQVEGEHRSAGWRMVLDHVPDAERSLVVSSMERCLEAWLVFRDGVALACGLEKDAQGGPRLAD